MSELQEKKKGSRLKSELRKIKILLKQDLNSNLKKREGFRNKPGWVRWNSKNSFRNRRLRDRL
jgi:hypothetical protein